jgi:hypothetical protein
MTSPEESSATSESNECSSPRCRVNKLDIRDSQRKIQDDRGRQVASEAKIVRAMPMATQV